MVYDVKISSEAYSDLNDIDEWLSENSTNEAIEFATAFMEETNYLSEHCKLHSFFYKPIRKKKMKEFPFLIYYSIHEDSRVVLIRAVWHQRKNTEFLLKRLSK